MKSLVRFTVYVVLVWTLCAVCFLMISFPEAFNQHIINTGGVSKAAPVSRANSFTQITPFKRHNVTSVPSVKYKPKQDWLRNFYNRKGNIAPNETDQRDFMEANVDYIVNETGGVKILVVNKTIKTADGKPDVVKNIHGELSVQTLRLRREDNERRYYTPRKTKVNPIDTQFIISGAQICSTDAKYMTILIIVPSIPSHYFVRDAIRTTYGSHSKRPFQINHSSVEVTVRLLFLVGRDGRIDSDRIIRNESRTYGDIVYADFAESYRNLTRKMLIALKWVSVYCSDVDFVLKVDEDVFVNIPHLAEHLHKRPYGIKGSVYGYINVHSSVRRKGKWGVTRDEFPLMHYPNYATGNSYVISGNVVPRMFMISEYLPYMPIEDAFITGCLARIVEARVVSVPGFTYWHDSVPDPCQFVRDKRVSATKVTTTIMEKLWAACNAYQEVCGKFEKRNSSSISSN